MSFRSINENDELIKLLNSVPFIKETLVNHVYIRI